MDKKTQAFLRVCVLLLLLLALSAPSAAFAAENPGGFIAEEHCLERDGQKIYGKLYLPENPETPLPLVLLSHGLGSDHRKMEPYAESFAEKGFAAFVFDYIGGSEQSLSDGNMKEMSVLTEAADLSCILDSFRADSRFSEDEIFLFGGSQGGFISAYLAGERPDDVAGLVLLYPAFNLQEICRGLVSDTGEIPGTAVIGKHTVGGIYVRDMLGFDIYELLRQYPGPVLLFHGTADPYVPLVYAQRAEQSFPDARLEIIEGAGHGFRGADMERVKQESAEFMRDILTSAEAEARAAA